MGNLVKGARFYLTVFNIRLFRYSLNSSKDIPWVSFEIFSFTASLVFIYIFEEVSKYSLGIFTT
jgi:hypothetical protein